jgi:hypothetical protein
MHYWVQFHDSLPPILPPMARELRQPKAWRNSQKPRHDENLPYHHEATWVQKIQKQVRTGGYRPEIM